PMCSLRKPAVYANFDPPRRSLPVGRQQSPIASAIAHPAMCSESAAKSLLLVEVGTPPRHESWAGDRWTDEGTARAPVVLSLCCDVPAAASVATGPIAGKSAGVMSDEIRMAAMIPRWSFVVNLINGVLAPRECRCRYCVASQSF